LHPPYNYRNALAREAGTLWSRAISAFCSPSDDDVSHKLLIRLSRLDDRAADVRKWIRV
jgi:hypothetical protein